MEAWKITRIGEREWQREGLFETVDPAPRRMPRGRPSSCSRTNRGESLAAIHRSSPAIRRNALFFA